MKVGIIVGRMGGEDGVALETEKWIHVLKKMGHKPYLLVGQFERDVLPPEQQSVYEPLAFNSKECEYEQDKAYFNPEKDPKELLTSLKENSTKAAHEISKWVKEKKIDAVLSENASALPCHLSMGMAIKKFAESPTGKKMPIVCHDHDWAWERGTRYVSPHEEINKIAADNFPLIADNVKHGVINEFGKETLQKRFEQESVVVPNVMDFDKPYAEKDDYNSDLRKELGIKDGEKALFQITRIVSRKRIDTAVELVDKLNKLRGQKDVKLVITGSDRDDDPKSGGVVAGLKKQAKELGVEDQIIYAGDRFDDFRGTNKDGKKIYTIEDAHSAADAETYFSDYEGFGNAFVEGVNAKKPIFVNNYKPVYWPDIGSKGFETVQIEDNVLTDEAVKRMNHIIDHPEEAKRMSEKNYTLGKKHFSYKVLQEKLEKLFTKDGAEKTKEKPNVVAAIKEMKSR